MRSLLSSFTRRVLTVRPGITSNVKTFSSSPVGYSNRNRPTSERTNSNGAQNLLSYGQPTLLSQPQFFQSSDEIIPGITKEEFRARRTKLCSMTSSYSQSPRTTDDPVSHLIIIPASTKKYMSENIPYPFRQNSNFFYLTGSYDPEAILALTVTSTGQQTHTMILSDPDPVSDLWDGRKTTPKAAVEHYGLDRAQGLSGFESFLRDFSLETENKYVIWCEDRYFIERIRSLFLSTADARPIQSPKGLIDSMRVIKSPGEIALMRKSCEIASEAFQAVMHFCRKRTTKNLPVLEQQIWAKIDYECRLNGAERLAYPPVVASGGRANIIHYVFNNHPCGEDEMVLVDAGCEFYGYCSDITRTWPVSGSFSNDRHRSLYEMVLSVQTELIRRVEPGNTLERLFKTMGPLMIAGLQELGILNKSLDVNSLGATELALRFCPHHVSHYLGMDVHDTPTVERNEILKPGMVITVEPGVYFSSSSSQKEVLTKVGLEFDGIGIRIEDDVLVTPDGNDVLTSVCPKIIQEIEGCALIGYATDD